jgi:hypothetical protein
VLVIFDCRPEKMILGGAATQQRAKSEKLPKKQRKITEK